MNSSTLTMLIFIVLTILWIPTLVESVPQYPGTFIKTNHSRHVPHPVGGEGQQHGGRQRHSATQVQTSTGLLHGIRKNVMGKDVHIYKGIPYARPPVGPLRFKKPIAISPWNGTYYAVQDPNTCFQESFVSFPDFAGEMMWNPNTKISEDCLYLNMWVPKTRKTNMPILVWIYGGGYMSGTATLDIYNGEILAAENNAIVVGIQYRVGSFGFLYFGNEDAPGNQAMWDQLEAIKWIKKNAKSFGGDPDSITLFGESAGGGSVSFHLLSPYSRDYISRGVIQSGTLNAPWSIMTAKNAKEIGRKLAADCNCTDESEGDILQCLRDLPAHIISAKQWESYSAFMSFPSTPVIDGKLLPKDPIEMLKEGDYKKTELLLGSNLNEGTYFMLYDYINHFKKDGPNCLPRETFLQIIEEISYFKNFTPVQKDALKFQYTYWEDPKDECKVTEKLAELLGDGFFICPSNKFAELYAENAPVYYYFFTQRTSVNPWGEWMGVMHADEIEYVFGTVLNGTNHTAAERDLSRRIMRYFTKFAETGRPTDDDDDYEWPRYTRNNPEYFILHSTERGTGKGPRAHTCQFWNSFMPSLSTTGTSSLPGSCEKGRWDTSKASSMLRGTTLRSEHGLMLMLAFASSLLLIFKELDICNKLQSYCYYESGDYKTSTTFISGKYNDSETTGIINSENSFSLNSNNCFHQTPPYSNQKLSQRVNQYHNPSKSAISYN